MTTWASDISEQIKKESAIRNPDLFLFIEDPYIEKLINELIEILSQEIADIRNEYISKKELDRLY